MKVLVVIGHQRLGSFCHAIAETACQTLRRLGHEVMFHDLYQERFDPVLPHEQIPKGAPRPPEIEEHCRQLREADGLVIVHPNWWSMPPAILKGWVDRVFCQGVAYEFTETGEVVEHLAGKRAVVFTTSNTPEDLEMKLFGDPLENLWRNCILGFCGVKDFYRRNFGPIITSTYEQRQEWLKEVEQIVTKRFARS